MNIEDRGRYGNVLVVVIVFSKLGADSGYKERDFVLPVKRLA